MQINLRPEELPSLPIPSPVLVSHIFLLLRSSIIPVHIRVCAEEEPGEGIRLRERI